MNPKDEITKRVTDYTLQLAERGCFYDIIDLFKSSVATQLIGMVKQVYKYRNWVAHGKHIDKNPPEIDPHLSI